MRILALMFLTATVFTSLALLSAGETPNVPPSRIVGHVYGKAVTAAEIGLTDPIDPAVQFDARDDARWELMERIIKTFGRPVMDRFVKRQKIEATVDEIDKFKSNMQKIEERQVREWQARLVELKKELAARNLSNEDRAKLEKEREMYERSVAEMRDPGAADALEEVARMFIVAWKTERELQRVYGGRVIFQQAGPEALDARRRLFEEAENNGEIKFDDLGVRHMFYYYANMRHGVIDENALEQPWFFGDDN
jgi:hypothetical protein